MATYTSVADGAWNTDATWDITGHPDTAADDVIIGHVVTYDVGTTGPAWNAVTVNSGGMLVFPTDASSIIEFDATGSLTVNSGGEIRTGTSGAVAEVGTAYTLEFKFAHGTTARNVMILNDGCTVDIRGNSSFYGDNRYAYLDSDWTAGQTFYLTGDYSAMWAAGQTVYIHKNGSYSSYLTDADTYTIATVGTYDSVNDRTPITISETAPGITYTAVNATTGHTSKLINCSRNVKLYDATATLGVGDFNSFTEFCRIYSNQGASNALIRFDDAMFYGFSRVMYGGYNIILNNICLINNDVGIYYGTSHTITGDFMSNNIGINSGTSHTVTGDFISNNIGIIYGTSNTVTGDFISNTNGINSGTSHTVTGDFISNNIGINYSTANTVTGDFISNTNNYANISSEAVVGPLILENCTLESANLLPYRCYQNAGDILTIVSGDTNWQVPPSSNTWELEVTPNSYCANNETNKITVFPLKSIPVYCASGARTVTFKVYPGNWTTDLTNATLVLKAKYFDGTGASMAFTTNSTATYADGGWRDLSVSFTAGQDAVAFFDIELRQYDAATNYVLIDPIPTVS